MASAVYVKIFEHISKLLVSHFWHPKKLQQELSELFPREHLASCIAVLFPNFLNYSLRGTKQMLIILEFGQLNLLTQL